MNLLCSGISDSAVGIELPLITAIAVIGMHVYEFCGFVYYHV